MGWVGAGEGDGDVSGLMTISEWDGVGEEAKANRRVLRLFPPCLLVTRHTPRRFSDGFLCTQRPPPPLSRRASDPIAAAPLHKAAADKAPAALADPPTKPRSSNLNAAPSSSKFSKAVPDPRARTPVKTPSREARAAAVTPHAAARERERLRARDRAQVA